MQSFFERRGPRLDTSLPSVRHIQELIRSRALVRVQLMNGQELGGTIKWQDIHFLALRQDSGEPLLLLRLEAVALIRSLP